MIGSVQGDKAARGQRWLLSAEEEEGRTKSDGERNETSTLDLETQTLFPSLSSFHPFSHRFPVRTQKTHTEKHTGTLQKGRSKERSKETKTNNIAGCKNDTKIYSLMITPVCSPNIKYSLIKFSN